MTSKKSPIAFSDNSERLTVTLQEPIARGNTTIDELQLRKPKAGELRGLLLGDLLNADVISVRTLLPRITAPPITEAEFDNLDPVDLVQLSTNALSFFNPKEVENTGTLDA
jgi:hypothetical protein